MKRVDTHNNFFFFTAALVFLLLFSAVMHSTPMVEQDRLFQIVIFLTELVAFFSLNLSRQWRYFVGVMLLWMLASNLLHEFTDMTISPLTRLVAMLIFFCGMAYSAARQVLFSGDIEPNTIVGAGAVYLLLGLIWSVMYLIALEYWPNGFNGIDYRDWDDNFSVAAYYSYVTMTSLGYGDISPLTPVAQILVILEAVTGMFYMAVVVASLIGGLMRGGSPLDSSQQS